jgi:TRAP transporter TAXI family solute receptor
MKRKLTIVLISCLIASGVFYPFPAELNAKEVFVSIGGGDFSGVYFPTGLAIAKMINNRRPQYGIRATVEATTGSTFNLNAILAGYMDFCLTQADKQYHALNGLFEWAEKGPQKQLRSVFSIYHEALTLVAAVDAGIESIADLRGKRVSLGNPGSSQHRMVIDTIEATGLDPRRDLVSQTVIASNAPDLLQDNRIDAYFFTVGHPNESVRKALSGARKARVVPISGPAIDKLVAGKKYLTRMPILMQQLYPDLPGSLDEVATFGVMATLCTSARVAEEVVYSVMKVVFENLEEFRRQHPALAGFGKENVLFGLSAPLHPGVLKYFREVGLLK